MVSNVDLFKLYYNKIKEHLYYNKEINNFITKNIIECTEKTLDLTAFKLELFSKFPILTDADFKTSLVSVFNPDFNQQFLENWTLNESFSDRRGQDQKSITSFISNNLAFTKRFGSPHHSPFKIAFSKGIHKSVTLNLVNQTSKLKGILKNHTEEKEEEKNEAHDTSNEHMIKGESNLQLVSFSKSEHFK